MAKACTEASTIAASQHRREVSPFAERILPSRVVSALRPLTECATSDSATVLSGGRRQEGDAPHRPSQADGGLDVRRGEGVDEAADHARLVAGKQKVIVTVGTVMETNLSPNSMRTRNMTTRHLLRRRA